MRLVHTEAHGEIELRAVTLNLPHRLAVALRVAWVNVNRRWFEFAGFGIGCSRGHATGANVLEQPFKITVVRDGDLVVAFIPVNTVRVGQLGIRTVDRTL